MTKCSKKVSIKWTSHLTQGWTSICGAQQIESTQTIQSNIRVSQLLIRRWSSDVTLYSVKDKTIKFSNFPKDKVSISSKKTDAD